MYRTKDTGTMSSRICAEKLTDPLPSHAKNTVPFFNCSLNSKSLPVIHNMLLTFRSMVQFRAYYSKNCLLRVKSSAAFAESAGINPFSKASWRLYASGTLLYADRIS